MDGPQPERHHTRNDTTWLATVGVDTGLTVPKIQCESVPDIRVALQRAAALVLGEDRLLVDLRANSRLEGLWFLGVPPFPNVEASA